MQVIEGTVEQCLIEGNKKLGWTENNDQSK